MVAAIDAHDEPARFAIVLPPAPGTSPRLLTGSGLSIRFWSVADGGGVQYADGTGVPVSTNPKISQWLSQA